MNEYSKKNNISNSDLEDSIRNEDYLLGFNSQYKTELYKEEELDIQKNEIKCEQMEPNKIASSDSTTNSVSQENNNSEINQKIKRDLSIDDSFFYTKGFFELYDKQRKMSSPLCDYLNGSDKYLSKILKSTVDIKHSQNFIKKTNYFRKEKSININIENQSNMNFNNINKNQNNKNNLINIKNNDNTEKYLKHSSFNNDINNNQLLNNINVNGIKNFNNNYIKNNLYFMNNNYPTQQIFNINYINLNNYPNNNIINKRKLSYNIEAGFIENYFNNILNQNIQQTQHDSNYIHPQNQPKLNPLFFSYNESQVNYSNSGGKNKLNAKKNIGSSKIPRKPLDKRKGDWNCPRCNNLNFAFRVLCNRCQFPKPNPLEGDND